MRRYAVIGNPVQHSRSPWLHHYFARRTQRRLVYAAYRPAAAFADCAAAFFSGGGNGLNITLPYKADALAFADNSSAFARNANAANVLKRARDGSISAYNTDGSALLCDLRDLSGDPRDKTILLLGAGGAARAAALALAGSKPQLLQIYNRTASRADQLARQLAPHCRAAAVKTPPAGADLIINATAAGHSDTPALYPESVFNGCPLVYDLSYGAAAQPFLTQAAAAGAHRTADGTGMLVRQAALSFALWEGVMPSVRTAIAELRRLA